MKYIKTYEGLFDFFKKKSKETDVKKLNIIKLCKLYNINDYRITDEYTVNVNGPVDLSFKNLKTIPIKFGVVRGTFDCSGNFLENLINSPFRVEANYLCKNQYNKTLKSLKGISKEIQGRFDCSDNENLKSFEYGPEIINYNIDISHTGISSLDFFPDIINSITVTGTPLWTIFRLSPGIEKDNEMLNLFREYDPIHPVINSKINLPFVGDIVNTKCTLYLDRLVDFLNLVGMERSAKHIQMSSSAGKDMIKKYYNIL